MTKSEDAVQLLVALSSSLSFHLYKTQETQTHIFPSYKIAIDLLLLLFPFAPHPTIL